MNLYLAFKFLKILKIKFFTSYNDLYFYDLNHLKSLWYVNQLCNIFSENVLYGVDRKGKKQYKSNEVAKRKLKDDVLLQLDFFLIRSTCQLDVNTKKAKQNKKSCLCRSFEHHIWFTKQISTIKCNNHECSHQKNEDSGVYQIYLKESPL